MTNSNLRKNIKGQYTAKRDMPIKYIYSLGGGLRGRTIKAGEIITAVDIVNDINNQSVSTLETLNRISFDFFINNFSKIN
jgi:hypothetical protein